LARPRKCFRGKERSRIGSRLGKGCDPESYMEDTRRQTALIWLDGSARRVLDGCSWHLGLRGKKP
jgi:hypothetical protein